MGWDLSPGAETACSCYQCGKPPQPLAMSHWDLKSLYQKVISSNVCLLYYSKKT